MCGRFGGIDGEDLLGEAGDPQSSALPASLSCCCTSTGLAVDRRDIPAVRNNIFQYCLERAAKIYIVDTPRDVPRMSSSLPSTLVYMFCIHSQSILTLYINFGSISIYYLLHHAFFNKKNTRKRHIPWTKALSFRVKKHRKRAFLTIFRYFGPY